MKLTKFATALLIAGMGVSFAASAKVTVFAAASVLGLVASSYIIPIAKTLELLCGIAFITGRYGRGCNKGRS